MTSPLRTWEAIQQAQLEELQAPSTDRSMMARLLETSCLLELSKLSPGNLDLGTYARTVVEVISQFFPLEGCELRLEVPGLPPMRASYGRIESEAVDDILTTDQPRPAVVVDHSIAAPLLLDEGLAGVLVISQPPGLVELDTFLGAATRHIAETLAVVVETERLRRKAAADTAMRLAASIDERSTEDDLDTLVSAVAALPGATGASLWVESPLHQPPTLVVSGLLDGPEMTTREERFEQRGAMKLVITWVTEPQPGERAQLDQIVDTLTQSLGRAERNRRLLEEAETDPLTGLANRRRVSRQLAAAVNWAERHGDYVALVAIDLDHFKAVNDSLGHDTGDRLLQTVAGVLRDEARSYDTAARLGGDEFVVVLPSTDQLGARAFATRVLERIAEVSAAQLPDGVGVTASIGVAVFPQDAAYSDQLLRLSDEALYAAKRAGRACVRPVANGGDAANGEGRPTG